MRIFLFANKLEKRWLKEIYIGKFGTIYIKWGIKLTFLEGNVPQYSNKNCEIFKMIEMINFTYGFHVCDTFVICNGIASNKYVVQ